MTVHLLREEHIPDEATNISGSLLGVSDERHRRDPRPMYETDGEVRGKRGEDNREKVMPQGHVIGFDEEHPSDPAHDNAEHRCCRFEHGGDFLTVGRETKIPERDITLGNRNSDGSAAMSYLLKALLEGSRTNCAGGIGALHPGNDIAGASRILQLSGIVVSFKSTLPGLGISFLSSTSK